MVGKRWAALGVSVAVATSLVIGVTSSEPARADATPPAPTFTTVLYDDFSGNSLDPSKWGTRLDNTIDGGRFCSVPVPANSVVANGNFAAKVSKTPKSQQKARLARAKAAQKAAKKKPVGCKYGLYDYSMMSSQDKISVSNYGRLSARVKFALGQGFHGGLWLRSINPNLELDAIESFGYGYGVTNFYYVGNKRYPSGSGKIITSTVKKKSWWSKYHTVTLTWVPNAAGATVFTFTIDGKVTRKATQRIPSAHYFLVVSNIVSSWEMPFFSHPRKDAKGVKKAKLPQSMLVDWIRLEQLNQ